MILKADVIAAVLLSTRPEGEELSAEHRDVFERVVEDLFRGAPTMTVEQAHATLQTALMITWGFSDALAIATCEAMEPEGDA